MSESENNISETISQILGLVVRRRWWIVASSCCLALATVGVSLRLANRYSSEAILLVVQQQVSQRYVETGANSSPAVVIQAITRNILSRSKLQGIAEELGLYAKYRQRLTLEELALQMQKDIEIEPLDDAGRNDFRAFKITFTAETPQLAQAAASRITSLFIEENLKNRGDQAAKTANFLSAEVEDAKKKLADQERRLQDFKMHNLGGLPEQQQANFAVLADRRMQLQNVLSALSRTQQQRLFLESSVGGKIALLQSERSNLLTRFTPRHAEVVKKEREIARFQSVLERIKGNGAGGDSGAGELVSDPSLVQWESQATSIAAETESLSKDKERLQAEIASYQGRVNFAPVREQEYASIVRDYDLYRKAYTDLLANQLQSQQTVSLEERQEGQQFRLVDPPTLPVFPSSPKRLKICLGGVGAGLFLGLALAFLMDMRKPCFHFESEIGRRFSLPLTVAIPVLLTPAEAHRQTRTRAVESVFASAFVVAVLTAEFYIYRHG